VATVYLRWTSSSDKQRVLDTYGLGKPVRREDVKYIKADYLIDNIELSFKVRFERPWGKHIPFDVFCEEILPYRLDTEPLENWREKALASFADLDEKLNQPDMTAVKACEMINHLLPQFRMDRDFPVMNFSQSMASSRGTCDNMAALAVFSMRALGIPVTFEYTTKWLESSNGHAWNSVRDSSGNHIHFMGASVNPYQYNLTNPPSKVYRKVYALQVGIKADADNIPPLLRESKNAKDVTAEYADVVDATVSIVFSPDSATNYVYLAFEQEKQWYPVAWTMVDGQVAKFEAIRKNVPYLPVYYYDGVQIPAGDPFWPDNDGMVLTLSTDHLSPRDTVLTLHEIAPSKNRFLMFMIFLKHGIFEGANKPDFSDAKVLHTITDIPNPNYNDVILNTSTNCRYVRYKSPKGSRCYLAELAFYDNKDEKLSGTNIGTPGSWKNSGKTCDKVFDNDVTTFFESEEKGSWTGLDLLERKRIRKIRYLPYTEGNKIYDRHDYELFCWTKDGWRSLGMQTATTNTLQFHVPSHALMYLENRTIGKKGRTFFITSDNNIYWR
jgi:hypothetical protein